MRFYIMWVLCLSYSTTSALGFAAQNREGTALAQEITHDGYKDTRRELLDLEARRRNAKQKDRARLDVDQCRFPPQVLFSSRSWS